MHHFASIDMESHRLNALFDEIYTLIGTMEKIDISIHHLEHLHRTMLAYQATLGELFLKNDLIVIIRNDAIDGKNEIEQTMDEIQRLGTGVRLSLTGRSKGIHSQST